MLCCSACAALAPQYPCEQRAISLKDPSSQRKPYLTSSLLLCYLFTHRNHYIRQVVENVQKIQAIELLMATHAVHRRRTMDHDGTSAGWGDDFVLPPRLRGLYATVGAMSPPMEGDRYLKVHTTPYLTVQRLIHTVRRISTNILTLTLITRNTPITNPPVSLPPGYTNTINTNKLS